MASVFPAVNPHLHRSCQIFHCIPVVGERNQFVFVVGEVSAEGQRSEERRVHADLDGILETAGNTDAIENPLSFF